MSDFIHDGVAIKISDKGKFVFQIGSEAYSLASLSAAKSKIETLKANEFKPYPVLIEDQYTRTNGELVVEVTATGPTSMFSKETKRRLWRVTVTRTVTKKPKYGEAITVYYSGDSQLDHHRLLHDTPDNIAAWKAYAEADLAEDVRHYAADRASDETRRALDWIK